MDQVSIKSLSEVAAEMGVKEPTLRSWTVHREVRPAGMVSQKGREPVIRFFCAHLPHLPEASVIDLLEGPYEDMAAAFLPERISSLSSFIQDEAVFENVKIVVEQDGANESAQPQAFTEDTEDTEGAQAAFERAMRDRGIARIKLRAPVFLDNRLPLGTNFRLEFPRAHRAKFFLGLQKSPQGWGVFPAGPKGQEKRVHMPAPEDHEELGFLCEDNDLGASRFALIQSVMPFPVFIHGLLLDHIPPSRSDIGLLTQHLHELSKNDRTVHAIDIEFLSFGRRRV